MNLVIIGGVSVNDVNRHDLNPYNFINSGIRKAKSLPKPTKVIVFAPSYELRATNQTREHKDVTVGQKCETESFLFVSWQSCSPKKRHFLDIAKNSATKAGLGYQEIRTANALTAVINAHKNIQSIQYFGHSNKTKMFLEYSAVVSTQATITWGEKEAKKIPATKFVSDAVFATYGCNQGDTGGLSETLSQLWGIRTIGSEGKTDFGPIGQGKTHPSSNGSYYEYEGGKRSAVTINN